MSYYDRQSATHIDGTPIFATEEDEQKEREVSALLEPAFRVKLHRFGKLAALDWFATRDERLVGVLELKSCTQTVGERPHAWLNVRKWLALKLAAIGLGVPAIFVVKWTDDVRYIFVQDVDASKHRMGGTIRLVKSRSDYEPIIEIPTQRMVQVKMPPAISEPKEQPDDGAADA